MKLKKLEHAFTVCQVESAAEIDLNAEFCFVGKSDEELSLVCPTRDVPLNTTAREDGWRGFRIQGVLDFSLIGILARLSALMAENGIGIFAVSTYNTDYIFVRESDFTKTMRVLEQAGYEIE